MMRDTEAAEVTDETHAYWTPEVGQLTGYPAQTLLPVAYEICALVKETMETFENEPIDEDIVSTAH